MTYDEMIKILEALRDGKKVEARRNGTDNWVHLVAPTDYPPINLNFMEFQYRIVPEPVVRWAMYSDEYKMIEETFDNLQSATTTLKFYPGCRIIKLVEVKDE
jgi:hypothetical protein